MDVLSQYQPLDLIWIGLGLFLMGMGKGGFPIGTVALPILIIVWPTPAQAAREAVGFMLPMLCLMDALALSVYWRHVLWGRLIYLAPATILGVTVASFLFVSDESSMIAVSDRMLKILIGSLGIGFVVYYAIKKWLLRHIDAAEPDWTKGTLYGFAAGMTSTMAHSAGPVLQMYLLPQQLEKKKFAATSCAFFWVLNLVKLLPFSLMGRIHADNLILGTVLLPAIPLGVGFGWLLTHHTQQKHYTLLIYAMLLIASVTLIVKAL